MQSALLTRMAQLQIQPNRLGIANQLPHDNGSTSRGSKVLRTSGNSLIAMGITEIILTIVLIVVPTFYCYLFSFVIFAFSSSVVSLHCLTDLIQMYFLDFFE